MNGPSSWGNPWHGYYQQDPNAYLYRGPYGVYTEPPRWSSAKYPTLNPILASDTTLLRFDVRKKPRTEILASTYYSNAHIPVTSNNITFIRLISKAFPWSIDIKAETPIVCETLWDALYVGLQQPILDSEWGFIIGNKKLRETIEKAAKKRSSEDPAEDKKLKRIDYLGEATLFKGLEKDEDFIKQRLIPGDKGCPETWLIKFA